MFFTEHMFFEPKFGIVAELFGIMMAARLESEVPRSGFRQVFKNVFTAFVPAVVIIGAIEP